MPEASDKVIIDHARCLHERVTDRRADKAKTALLEVPAHGVGLWGGGGDLFHALPTVLSRLASGKLPDVTIEASEFFLHAEKCLGVADRRFDLETVAYDAGIREEQSDFFAAEAGDLGRIESGESGTIVRAFPENGVPAEAGLGAFKNEKFEPSALVAYRHAPFPVVVRGEAVVRFSPGTALQFHRSQIIRESLFFREPAANLPPVKRR
jgi:hypothetical protein